MKKKKKNELKGDILFYLIKKQLFKSIVGFEVGNLIIQS